MNIGQLIVILIGLIVGIGLIAGAVALYLLLTTTNHKTPHEK